MIEIGKPLTSAWTRMTEQLFRPFDFGKWLVLAFSAFLADLLSSSFSMGNSFKDSKNHFAWQDFRLSDALADWQSWLPWTAFFFGLSLAFWLLFLWLGTRGRFIFLDNVIRNRTLIVVPWKEQSVPANRLFVFLAGVGFLAGLVMLLEFVVILGFFWSDLQTLKGRHFEEFIPFMTAIGLGTLIWIPVALFFILLREFGIPLIYHTGCSPWESVGKVWNLVKTRPLEIGFFLLLKVAFAIAFAVVAMIIGICTCCMGFIPYISSVIFLPISVFLLGFTLDYLAELDPNANVWARFQPPALP